MNVSILSRWLIIKHVAKPQFVSMLAGIMQELWL